jgi:hypothetical protein
MARKSIKTIAGLERAWNATNRRNAHFYKRLYILQPALARHLERLEYLEQIDDADTRYQVFRHLPSLEFELETVNGNLTPQQRESLAQQDRASRPRIRLTEDGHTLEMIIFELLTQVEDPWRKKAKQYWQPMVDRLGQLGLNPSLLPDPAHPSNEIIEYDSGDKRRSLTSGQFENIVSRVRRRSRGNSLSASG